MRGKIHDLHFSFGGSNKPNSIVLVFNLQH